MSKQIRFKGIVATLAQIAADAFAGRISWASDLARPVHYYTDSDYAVLARKDVAETFPEVKITNQAGPVARMVQAGTDGTQSAVSAATARSTIGAQEALGYTPVNKAGDTMTGGLTLTSLVNSATAGVGIRPKVALADGTDAVRDAATFRGVIGAQEALGYTPANRAGDTFSGQVVVTDPTNVVAQPKLLVSVGGGSASGEVGFHSDGASEGNKNWGAGVSRDFSCFRIMSYTDDWSGRTECIRAGTDYLDLSNPYANALAVGYKIGGLKVVGGRKLGWAAPTGTATRTTFATSTVTLQQLAERVKALIDDLTAHGLIGP